MKIAIIGSRGYPYTYSGYETFVRELSQRLVQRQIEVTVYCHKNLFKKRPDRLNSINLIYLQTIEKKNLSQFIHSLQSILHACFRNYDIILVVNAANGPFGLLTKVFRKKTAINVDGLEWQRPRWKGLGARYFFWAAKLATRLYDVIITDALVMQKIYRENFQAESIMITYGAQVRHSQNPDLIKRWGLEKEGYYLVVSRLIPDNNIAIILEEFLNSASQKKLVIAGDMPHVDHYIRNLRSYRDERIIFTGFINDREVLSELYLNCYAYLHGHEFGGTNPTLLEALGCGCAVIALDTPFNREVLVDGRYGLFFHKQDGSLKELIAEIERYPQILTDYRRLARDRIKEAYTWEKIVGQYIRLFEDMQKRKTP